MTGQELPPPTEADKSPPRWADTSMSRKEEANWDDVDKLQGVKASNDILWHKCYGLIVVFLMVFFVLVFVASLGAWIIHQITPWCWLTPEQLSKIQSVIFSGSLGAIVSSYMQKQLQK
ncbi:hypothetical protein FHS77_003096 [Paenochrobactrum gallinarii]|uniref:Uncharacterized protein n=1 Tax=Paenochrobactrum gallinarii TaxID=643673 RepID=A0A841M0E7_9HYPH|nr:hypothetical protein [Paenochrobactrum gallinarii]